MRLKIIYGKKIVYWPIYIPTLFNENKINIFNSNNNYNLGKLKNAKI